MPLQVETRGLQEPNKKADNRAVLCRVGAGVYVCVLFFPCLDGEMCLSLPVRKKWGII